jgi:hypothetical protein
MNSKWHFYVSLVKSLIRIAACIIPICIGLDKGIYVFLVGFAVAELLGIAEEIFDKR